MSKVFRELKSSNFASDSELSTLSSVGIIVSHAVEAVFYI